LPLPETPKRTAQIVLRRRPVTRHALAGVLGINGGYCKLCAQ
jgi:hypothetical protein